MQLKLPVLPEELKLSVLPEGLQVFRKERWLPTSCYILEWAYNKTHLLCALWPVPYTSKVTPRTVVPSMHGTHCKHNSLVSSSVFNNNLDLLIYGGIWDGTYASKYT